MKERDQSRFGALVSWAQQHGAELHPSLEVYCDPVTKFSIRVKEKEQLPAGEALLQPGFAAFSCPFSITLSHLNALPGSGPPGSSLGGSSAATPAAFPPRFMATVPPHVIGRFFLMQQYLLGAESFWHPYIATLPQPEQPAAWALPAFWPDDDAVFLHGTNARVAVDEMQANARREFKQARKALKEDADMFPQWQDYTRLLYNWAFCIFTSRSFRPSLIASAHARDAIAQALAPAAGRCGIDDFSVLQPLFDIANHSMTSRYTWDVSSGPLPCCRLVCLDAYGPGEQVYNNYGLKTNSELLLGYGFVVPETAALHNDYAHVRKRGGGGSDSSSELAGGGGGDKPKDFLISLRPLTDPSSVVGRARPPPSCTLLSTSRGPLHLLPEFAHFEPALVYDLAEALSARPETPPAAAGEEPRAGASQAVELVVEDEDEDALVGRIKEALAAKLQYDYQQLEEAAAAGGGDGAEPANQNQRLAHEYRRQCGKVLLAALQSLAA
ncbi:hypothetical protein B0T26DRAFT_650006 [Lasiosphaeria miniovina]|uniref:SET domain-containing protein n=1 Tax=Lasiosphaeria miniovina TaxID=1954250 RepID=A0AA40ACB5_9PEZI|nr:uncharacterized protein B0T26DRAFT_650006 [Lasiosphaeria miniovina]KAK0713264.1 hypothetical protein B0T26DRAFT_650006 [Lasiosphaeria miniovina]